MVSRIDTIRLTYTPTNIPGTSVGAVWSFISLTTWSNGSENVYNPCTCLVGMTIVLSIDYIHSL